VDGVHVHDEVLEHGEVAHRLDRDRRTLPALVRRVPAQAVRDALGLVEVGVAGERGLAVDAYAAGAADRGAAGAADPDRAVLLIARLQDAVEDGALAVQVDLELFPVRRLAGFRQVAADLEGELGHRGSGG
jgi:hypothetical protein